MVIMLHTLGARIRFLRNQAGLSQKQLAIELNMSRTKVSKWESSIQDPSLQDLLSICDYFDVSLDQIMGRFLSRKDVLHELNTLYKPTETYIDVHTNDILHLIHQHPNLKEALLKMSVLSPESQKELLHTTAPLLIQMSALLD
ncbi:helix-turn-helix transcriptional regulator [Priestia megaterium]|nr:helix-turn-helix transcriptional regulator [Priestia megaterium]